MSVDVICQREMDLAFLEGHSPTSTLSPPAEEGAEPEKEAMDSEVWGRMPTCPQGPGPKALHQRDY